MDRSKYALSAFKSKKTVESNAIRLCHDIEAYYQDHENQKTKKSLQKYTDRILNILKGEHKLSKTDDLKNKLGRVFAYFKIIEFVLLNITIFSLETLKDLFLIFTLSIDYSLKQYFQEYSNTLAKLLITPVSMVNFDLLCGQFLRDLMLDPQILRCFLSLEVFHGLIEAVCNKMFEIQSDALVSIRTLLISPESHNFVNQYSLNILQGLYRICNINYYVTRSSLNLIYLLICEEKKKVFISSFVENEENLKYAMTLMKRDTHNEIRSEAFLIFSQICMVVVGRNDREKFNAFKIIRRNRNNLIKFLKKFQNERNDQVFQDLKLEVIQIIESIA